MLSWYVQKAYSHPMAMDFIRRKLIFHEFGLCAKLQAECTPTQYSINYRKTSNIRRALIGNKIVDHLDVVGASPVGAAPTTSSFST